MLLELVRTYFFNGTNGKILHKGVEITCSIELPWRDNRAGVSCIPEGKYELVKRWGPRFGRHLQVRDVPQRKDILIHPANDALRELKGCIAPVCFITGSGKGIRSRLAMKTLSALVYAAFDRHDQVFIIIKSKANEYT